MIHINMRTCSCRTSIVFIFIFSINLVKLGCSSSSERSFMPSLMENMCYLAKQYQNFVFLNQDISTELDPKHPEVSEIQPQRLFQNGERERERERERSLPTIVAINHFNFSNCRWQSYFPVLYRMFNLFIDYR